MNAEVRNPKSEPGPPREFRRPGATRRRFRLRTSDFGLRSCAGAVAGLGLLASWPAAAADWPTYMHDAQRSGTTAEQLGTNLVPAWIYPRAQKPVAAWADEAKRNEFLAPPANQRPLKARLGFDYANQVAVAGGRLYFGSSTEDTLTCLDTQTGEPQWTFFTDGPVRMAPTVDHGRVYAGSDDGSVYCLDASTGGLLWKNTPAATNNYLIPNNGRFVSPWAVRSSVVVDGAVAYFAAGIFPSEGVYCCAVDALTGTRTAANHWQQCLTNVGSVQGYALASRSRLYLPAARCTPLLLDRLTGALLGQYTDKNALGTFALLAGTSVFLGPAPRAGGAQISQAGEAGGDALATYAGNALIVTTNRTFLLSDTALTALNRATRATLWTRSAACPYALILAGTTLFAGGDKTVARFDANTGAKLWSASVRGRAHGLAVANGLLYVSTDQGVVHAFAPDAKAAQSVLLVF